MHTIDTKVNKQVEECLTIDLNDWKNENEMAKRKADIFAMLEYECQSSYFGVKVFNFITFALRSAFSQ